MEPRFNHTVWKVFFHLYQFSVVFLNIWNSENLVEVKMTWNLEILDCLLPLHIIIDHINRHNHTRLCVCMVY